MATNMTMIVKGSKLLIEVDVSKAAIDKAEMSSSGKNKLLATSRGYTDAPVPGVRVSLNVTSK